MEHEKPDIAAYTHFKGSEALGTGVPDKGTSTACPVVAGCIAALRTRLSFESTSPIALNALLRQTARHAQTAAWNGDLGFGIIDPLAAAQASALIPES
jgi:Subtilase family